MKAKRRDLNSKLDRNADLRAETQTYIQDTARRIDKYVEQRFNFQECVEIQKRHLLRDLILNSINAVWIIPSLAIRKVLEVAEKLGWDNARHLIPLIPQTIRTGFQMEIEQRLAAELFDVPSHKGAASELTLLLNNNSHQIRREIKDYCEKQNSITDLAASGGTTLLAYFAAGDYTQNIFGIGRKAAAIWSQKKAESSFFLGPAMGSLFYKISPPEPTLGSVVVATSIALVLLAVISTGVGMLNFSLQVRLGLKQSQLQKLNSSIEDRLLLSISKRQI